MDLSKLTLYPEKNVKLPLYGIIKLPDNYEKVDQISNGSYTSVFCVTHKENPERKLAAKYMKDKKKHGNSEVDILKKLQNCHHIVKLIEEHHDNYQTILITEYLSGGNLFERLSEPQYQLTEGKCKIFLRQILSGVAFLHQENIIHMNITPYNIIFHNKNSDDGLKIIDFGHSLQLPADTGTVKLSRMQGTLEYLSPEVLRCDQVGRPADMWAIGVILYMLVTGGVSPFYAGNRIRTMMRSLHAAYDMDIEQIKKTSQSARDLITSLLKTGPSSRLTAEECLKHVWLRGSRLEHQPTLVELETKWMKQCLARRRWHRAFNAIQALRTMRKLSSAEYRNSEESRKLSLELSNLRSLDICHNLSTPQDFSEFQQRFESVNQVGSGTFGSVYLVKDSSSNGVAAAKYLRQTKESVRNEAAILFQLIQSAFIVKIIGLYESPLHSVLVTEYLSGGDLVTRTASDDYCLTEEKCQIFIKQIVRGLQFIHSKNIIHLDLKPFNVIFANPNDDHNLRIIDFGLAEQLKPDEKSIPMKMCGTLEYMSPEVLNSTQASPASDMWGLGVVAYLMVSGGMSPFWAGSRYRIMARILKCEYNFDLPNFQLVSKNAIDFIKSTLVLNPEDRSSATSCLQHPWLTHIGLNLGLSEKEHWTTLETAWMRGILARRRWHRWFHAINATHKLRKLSIEHQH